MTNTEAIEILSRPFDMKNVPQDILEAHKMAISALEKQEGKKPEETGFMGVHIPACQNCKNPLMFITESARSDFCPKCGQKILWVE